MANTKTSNPAAKFESFNWMRGVSRAKRIRVIHRFILVRLCIYRDEKKGGLCDPGYDAVAMALGIDRKTVMRAVDEGVRYGWLAPPTRVGRRENFKFVFLFPDHEVPSGGTSNPDHEVPSSEDFEKNLEVPFGGSRSPFKGSSKSSKKHGFSTKSKASSAHGHTGKENGQEDIYRPPDFAAPDLEADAGAEPDRKSTPKASDASNRSIADPAADQAGENVYTKKNDVNNFDLAAAFAEFWAACPRKVGREKTFKLFCALAKRGVDPRLMISAMQRYAVAVARAGKKPEHIKLPFNWLTDGYYDEAPSAPVTIDEHGNEIVEPPRPSSRPKSIEEIAVEMLAEFRGKP